MKQTEFDTFMILKNQLLLLEAASVMMKSMVGDITLSIKIDERKKDVNDYIAMRFPQEKPTMTNLTKRGE